jgi:hypothetical protein
MKRHARRASRSARAAGLIGTVVAVALAFATHSALALTVEPMEFIVRGHVAAVKVTREMPAWVSARDDIPVKEQSAFMDESYRITLDVDAVERGPRDAVKPRIELFGWCALQRPPGWPHSGETRCKAPLPVRGEELRVHMKVGLEGWTAVSPSGWEVLRDDHGRQAGPAPKGTPPGGR